MSTQTVSPAPYFTAKARAAFTKAGGNPDNAGPLAAWAEALKTSGASREDLVDEGVVVAQDGSIVAEVRYHRSPRAQEFGGSTRISEASAAAYNISTRDIGVAIRVIERKIGQLCMVVKYADVCEGRIFTSQPLVRA